MRVFIDPATARYGEVVQALRHDPQQVIVAPLAGGEYSSLGTAGPRICKTDRTFSKTISILYPPRDKHHIGAILDMYLDKSGRVEIAEFYVMRLAP